MLCSNLQTKVIESKFTNQVTKGWRGVLHSQHTSLATLLDEVIQKQNEAAFST